MVSVDGEVCLERGILEYVAVTAGGKEYESVFRLYCRPAHLQQALLMAGCQIGEVDEQLRGDYSGSDETSSPGRADGAPAPSPRHPTRIGRNHHRLLLSWRSRWKLSSSDGSWLRRPIEELLIDRRLDGPPKKLRWAFTGSYFVRRGPDDPEAFAADQTLSVIALWYDPIRNPEPD